jgi:hypothetical protein
MQSATLACGSSAAGVGWAFDIPQYAHAGSAAGVSSASSWSAVGVVDGVFVAFAIVVLSLAEMKKPGDYAGL